MPECRRWSRRRKAAVQPAFRRTHTRRPRCPVRLLDWLTTRLLRAHVARGAKDHAGSASSPWRRDCWRLRNRSVGVVVDRLHRFSQVRNPEPPIHWGAGRTFHVGRLEITVNDPVFMRSLESLRNLLGRYGSASSMGTERRARCGQPAWGLRPVPSPATLCAVKVFQAVDARDVRMIQ